MVFFGSTYTINPNSNLSKEKYNKLVNKLYNEINKINDSMHYLFPEDTFLWNMHANDMFQIEFTDNHDNDDIRIYITSPYIDKTIGKYYKKHYERDHNKLILNETCNMNNVIGDITDEILKNYENHQFNNPRDKETLAWKTVAELDNYFEELEELLNNLAHENNLVKIKFKQGLITVYKRL